MIHGSSPISHTIGTTATRHLSLGYCRAAVARFTRPAIHRLSWSTQGNNLIYSSAALVVEELISYCSYSNLLTQDFLLALGDCMTSTSCNSWCLSHSLSRLNCSTVTGFVDGCVGHPTYAEACTASLELFFVNSLDERGIFDDNVLGLAIFQRYTYSGAFACIPAPAW